MLQFCRFIPVLKQKYKCRITLAALPTLHELLRSVEGVEAVVGIYPPNPVADVQCSLMSVPRFLGTTLGDIPATIPYLKVNSNRVARWKDRLSGLQPGLRIGLFWAGTQVDPNRIIRLAELAPLWEASVKGRGGPITFVSLQKGPGEEELEDFGLPITALGHELLDFADTSAVLANLDLLITIDTAVAHAAGALGKKAWVLLPFRPDWRWLLDRTDSPWYPTLRLYRQAQRRHWDDTIARVAQDLVVLTKAT